MCGIILITLNKLRWHHVFKACFHASIGIHGQLFRSYLILSFNEALQDKLKPPTILHAEHFFTLRFSVHAPQQSLKSALESQTKKIRIQFC